MTLDEITINICDMAKPSLSALTYLGVIEFAGSDAQNFLHNQLTCDVANLAIGRSTYGAYCTPKGRALASFLLWRTENGFYLQLPVPLCEPILKQLSKYMLRAKAKAADVSADWKLIGIAGAGADSVVQDAVGKTPSKLHDIVVTPGAMAIRLPGERHEIAATPEKVPAILASAAASAETAGPDYWEWLDIRAGIPTIVPATQEEFVPQMLNLDILGGVSLTKGCYPGQEIVARMHYRGTLKQRMHLANVASGDVPRPGEKLYGPAFGEQACGTVVNAARSPEGGCDLLAVIQIAAAEKGDLHWKAPSGASITMLPLPYAVPGDR